MPTKTLVASARAAHMARRAADFGVTLGGAVRVDMRAVKARKDRIVEQSVRNLTSWLQATPGLELVRGHARFVGPHAVAVGGRVLDAPQHLRQRRWPRRAARPGPASTACRC